MKMKVTFLLDIASITLAACATPEQRCERDAVGPYNNLQFRIVQAEQNIIRGYAIEKVRVEQAERSAYPGASNRPGHYTITTRIPIDPALEQ